MTSLLAGWRPGLWRGECYEAAAKLILERDEQGDAAARLVHGEPLGTGGDARGLRYGHAWVETRFGSVELVWDLSASPVPVGREIFYEAGSLDESSVRRYTAEQARAFLFETHGHYGPWEGPFAGPPRPKCHKCSELLEEDDCGSCS